MKTKMVRVLKARKRFNKNPRQSQPRRRLRRLKWLLIKLFIKDF